MERIATAEKIRLVDLGAQYQAIHKEIWSAMRNVVENSAFVLGKHVKDFEGDFAAFCNARFAIGVASGTDALTLSLKALEIGPGDEVITAPNSAFPTAEAITLTGAKVVFADINPDTFNIDPAEVEKKITKKTKAIMPVHLYGLPAQMDELEELCRTHDLKLVEDAAQAHGAEYKGRRVGTIGNVACFSFYPSKNLGAYGDGGAVVTNDEAIADKARMLRNHGRHEKYCHEIEGCNSRLDALQAAILSVKLKYLDEWNKKRRQHARYYDELLSSVENVITPTIPAKMKSVHHVYVIRVRDRDNLRKKLKEDNIDTGIHYPIPLHLQPALAYMGLESGSFPKAEEATSTILSLPLYPEMSKEQVERVADAVKQHAK
ncbi:MAG: DegT/DnrJ/EryC1/StrS family aminotransferase [Candidatus Brocadiales bacterium]